MAFREEDHPRDNDGKFTDKEGGKTYRQNVSYETILTGETTRRKPEQATGFNRLNTAHHQRHAKEMGYANLKEYEKAAVNFFNSDRGQLYYSTKWEKFYRYDKTTQELAVSSGGVVHTFWKRTPKEFERIRRQDKLDEL